MKTPLLSNVFKVARWEFVKNVKSPMFLVFTFVIPLFMVIGGGIGFLAEHFKSEEKLHMAVLDRTGIFLPYLEEQSTGTLLLFTPYEGVPEQYAYVEELTKEEIDGILVVDEKKLEEGSLLLLVKDEREVRISRLQYILNSAVASYRMDRMGLDAGDVYTAIAPIILEKQQIIGEEPDIADFIIPVIAGVVLIMSVMLSGQILLYGVVKEKRNRVVEILLSSISSLELLLGKIAGFGTLSLTQITLWLGAGLVVATAFLDIPDINLTAAHVIPPVLFFFFGYLMFFSIFAALGATMKEAEGGSQGQGLIVVIPMLPIMFVSPLLETPNALWVRVISHVPFFTPTAVLLRMGVTTLPLWEMATTLTALILSTGVFIYLGSRIFEGTILQYDRSAGLKDLKLLFSRK